MRPMGMPSVKKLLSMWMSAGKVPAASIARLAGSVAFVLIAVVGCAAPADQSAQVTQPAAGALIADAAFPPIGATWRVRITDSANGHVREATIAAVPIAFDGHPAYGLSYGRDTDVLNPATFNRMASVRNGKVTFSELPDEGQYSWPLWVGNAWTSTFNFYDAERSYSSGPDVRYHKVIGYEDVSVPAGTFKAFRIEQTPGQNDAVSSTIWYAPDVRTAVKVISRREAYHYLGPTQFTTELLELPK